MISTLPETIAKVETLLRQAEKKGKPFARTEEIRMLNEELKTKDPKKDKDKTRIGEIFEEMKRLFQEKVSAVVAEAIAEEAEGNYAIDEELEKLTEGRYLSPEKLNECLQKLSTTTQTVSLPETEIKRLRKLLPRTLTEEMTKKIELLKTKSEENAIPLIQQIPKVFTLNGEEQPFTIKNLQAVWTQAKEENEWIKKGLWINTDFVPEELQEKVWEEGELRAYTSTCLKDSKNKTYKDQIKHQEKEVGKEAKIGADMFLAMAFRYMATEGNPENELLTKDYIRLNIKGSGGDALDVYTDEYDLSLDSLHANADTLSGIGASLRIFSSSDS